MSSAATKKCERKDFEFDVFLSYRSPDKESVREIAGLLHSRALRVWWDEEEIPPGALFANELWKAIQRCWAMAVFIGPRLMGGWQEQELLTAVNQQVREGKPVIPIFLPGANPDEIKVPFLDNNSRLVFESSLNDTLLIDRLWWGITGIKPASLSPPPADAVPTQEPPSPPTHPATQPADETVSWLSDWLRSGNVTFFVGPGATGGGPKYPPLNWELARTLLRQLNLVGSEELKFLPPVDVVATLFAVWKSDPVLENTIITEIQTRSSEIPDSHLGLAKLLAALKERRQVPRGKRLQKQLLLGSNIDLMIERALLSSGVRFTRVVQHKSESSLYVTNFHDEKFLPSKREDLDDLISNKGYETLSPESVAGDALVEPILYKLRGSQDIEGSCALSRPQFLAQARSVISEHLIPSELQKIASNTPLVFLGTGLLDPDFQYISYTMLFDAWKSDKPKYMVQLAPAQDQNDPYRRMETGIWNKIKETAMQIRLTAVEDSSASFLRRLNKEVESWLQTSGTRSSS
jgi:TIR domain